MWLLIMLLILKVSIYTFHYRNINMFDLQGTTSLRILNNTQYLQDRTF